MAIPPEAEARLGGAMVAAGRQQHRIPVLRRQGAAATINFAE